MASERNAGCQRPSAPSSCSIRSIAADVADARVVPDLLAGRPDVIFDLAAVVSGEAEDDFEKGYRVNLDGTRLLLEAVREAGPGYRPRLVITSTSTLCFLNRSCACAT